MSEAGEDLGRGAQRLDKWLWYARQAKTRTLAAGLVTAGKIRVNRLKVEKPSQLVRPGDVITSNARKQVRVLKVVALGIRRGPSAEAAALFQDLTPQTAGREVLGKGEAGNDPGPQVAAPGQRLRGSGRPTKRDRRLIGKLTGGQA